MRKAVIAAGIGLAVALSGTASANIIMQGNFIKTQISNDGTLGDGSGLGLIYDRTGQANFNRNFDYIAPGTPFEAFGIRYNTSNGSSSGLLGNNNNSGGGAVGSRDSFALTSLTDVSATSTADNHVKWVGGNSVLKITHDFFFNNQDERINIKTTIKALFDVNNLVLARAVDPDPDSRSHGTASTKNQRGIDTNNNGSFNDAGDVPVKNFVGSIGSVSGTPLGLFANTNFVQNTGIVDNCCSVFDPNTYLAGGNKGNSSVDDNGIGIAFNLGNLNAGQSVSVNYAYVMGGSLSTINLPPPPATSVPEPTSLALLGLGVLAFARRFKR